MFEFLRSRNNLNYLPAGKEYISSPTVGLLTTTQLHFSHTNLYVNRSWVHKDTVLASFLISVTKLPKNSNEGLFLFGLRVHSIMPGALQ